MREQHARWERDFRVCASQGEFHRERVIVARAPSADTRVARSIRDRVRRNVHTRVVIESCRARLVDTRRHGRASRTMIPPARENGASSFRWSISRQPDQAGMEFYGFSSEKVL